MVNGAVLALLALASVHPRWLADLQNPVWMVIIILIVGVTGRALWIFLVWSAGESLLRVTRPDFSTSLDSLLRGRLGPRGGRALLLGCALGGGLAGARLAIYALATALPGLSPAGASVELPVFQGSSSPILNGLWLAAGVTLATAVAVRFLPDRWVLPAAALLAGFGLAPLRLYPFPAELAANLAFAGALVWICRRFGLTTLIVAAVVSFLLPAALYSGLHAGWLPGTFAITGGLTAGIALLGLVGLARPEAVEAGILPPPAFMRRLAHERRLQHEVDLLARMQVGLLPQEMPRVEGLRDRRPLRARQRSRGRPLRLPARRGRRALDRGRRRGRPRLLLRRGPGHGEGRSPEPDRARRAARRGAPTARPRAARRQHRPQLHEPRPDPSRSCHGRRRARQRGPPLPPRLRLRTGLRDRPPRPPPGCGPRRLPAPYEDRAFELPRAAPCSSAPTASSKPWTGTATPTASTAPARCSRPWGTAPPSKSWTPSSTTAGVTWAPRPPPDDVTVVVVKRG